MNNQNQYNQNPYPLQPLNQRVCPICGSTHFAYSTVSYDSGTDAGIGCLMVFLIFIPVIGWIIDLILLFTCCGTNIEVSTFAICQICGHREFVPQQTAKQAKKQKKLYRGLQKMQKEKLRQMKKYEKEQKRMTKGR